MAVAFAGEEGTEASEECCPGRQDYGFGLV